MSTIVVPQDAWVWKGGAGHFCGASACCFHLHTQIGRFCVSSVGCYHPDDPLRRNEPSYIGAGRMYETMVFDTEDPDRRWREIDFDAYDDAESAERGHLEMCRRWATKPQTAQPREKD